MLVSRAVQSQIKSKEMDFHFFCMTAEDDNFFFFLRKMHNSVDNLCIALLKNLHNIKQAFVHFCIFFYFFCIILYYNIGMLL